MIRAGCEEAEKFMRESIEWHFNFCPAPSSPSYLGTSNWDLSPTTHDASTHLVSDEAKNSGSEVEAKTASDSVDKKDDKADVVTSSTGSAKKEEEEATDIAELAPSIDNRVEDASELSLESLTKHVQCSVFHSERNSIRRIYSMQSFFQPIIKKEFERSGRISKLFTDKSSRLEQERVGQSPEVEESEKTTTDPASCAVAENVTGDESDDKGDTEADGKQMVLVSEQPELRNPAGSQKAMNSSVDSPCISISSSASTSPQKKTRQYEKSKEA